MNLNTVLMTLTLGAFASTSVVATNVTSIELNYNPVTKQLELVKKENKKAENKKNTYLKIAGGAAAALGTLYLIEKYGVAYFKGKDYKPFIAGKIDAKYNDLITAIKGMKLVQNASTNLSEAKKAVSTKASSMMKSVQNAFSKSASKNAPITN